MGGRDNIYVTKTSRRIPQLGMGDLQEKCDCVILIVNDKFIAKFYMQILPGASAYYTNEVELYKMLIIPEFSSIALEQHMSYGWR